MDGLITFLADNFNIFIYSFPITIFFVFILSLAMYFFFRWHFREYRETSTQTREELKEYNSVSKEQLEESKKWQEESEGHETELAKLKNELEDIQKRYDHAVTKHEEESLQSERLKLLSEIELQQTRRNLHRNRELSALKSILLICMMMGDRISDYRAEIEEIAMLILDKDLVVADDDNYSKVKIIRERIYALLIKTS
jgi:Skp family chaperone for outer membrane proteins